MIDELRARFPRFGFALSAYDPDDGVTLEILDEQGNVFSFKAKTAVEAVKIAFPDMPIVTIAEPTLAERLIESAQQAREIARGELEPARAYEPVSDTASVVMSETPTHPDLFD